MRRIAAKLLQENFVTAFAFLENEITLRSLMKVKLGLLQTWADSDPVSNLKRTLQLAHAAADRGAQIISTQELFRSPYFCQNEDHANFALAEEIPNGPSTQAFMELAKSRGVVIVASLFEKRAAGVYHNTAAIIDADGTYLGKYRKMHIPDDPLFYEKFYFTPGDLGFRTWETKFGKIGVLVCWDQWYPEAARLTAMQRRADSFLPDRHRLASERARKYGEAHHSSWETIQRSHAVANGCYVA
jgi:N-carbamoylputrescine amidase